MATIALNYYCDLNQAVKVQYIDGNVFSGDNAGNTISVFVMDGDQPATIGGSVSADVIRADGSTVAVSGALDGNRAYVILPQACYAVPGSISIVIKNTQNTTITTIAALVGNVYRSSTDEIVDPGTIIPSISSLIAAIDAAIGSIPADYSALLASIAADYSSSKTYPVGAYCWEAGVLKRCIVPITSAETYTAAHWTNAVIGDDLSALKRALENKVYHYFVWHDGKFINSSGAISDNSSRAYSDLILCPGGTVCKYIGDTSNSSINGISFYDRRGVYISGVANNVTLGTEATVTAPANSWYCRITTRLTMKDTTYLTMDNSVVGNTVAGLAEYIDVDAKYDLYKSTATENTLLTESGTIDSSGNSVANNDYLRSDFIPVKAGDKIHYDIAQYTTLCAVAVYNTNKVFSSGVLGVGTTTLVSGIFTASADGFVRFSCYKTSLSMCKIYFLGSFVEELASLSVGPTFYCGAGRELATLKAGLETATQYMNATLFVDPGTYDLIDEFGDAWFEALDGTKTLVGLQLKNRIHVIFSPNSKVVSHYTGDNEYAQSLYSPFNAGEYGFTIENLTLECSGCRYAIHDERNGGTEIYKSHYINCNVYIDNSQNAYWSSRCGIGGGLGSNAEVIIENCVWGSDNPDTSNARNAVYYHLSNSTTNANHKAVVTIKDNYFITGCIQLDPGRLTTTAENSTFVITNNSFAQRYNGADEQGVFHASLDPETSDLYEWNNVIRSNN